MVIRYIFEHHCQVRILEIVFKLFKCFTLRHNFWMVQQPPEKELLSTPVQHCKSRLHIAVAVSCLSFLLLFANQCQRAVDGAVRQEHSMRFQDSHYGPYSGYEAPQLGCHDQAEGPI